MELPDGTTTVTLGHPWVDVVPARTAVGLLALVHRRSEGRLELPDRMGAWPGTGSATSPPSPRTPAVRCARTS